MSKPALTQLRREIDRLKGEFDPEKIREIQQRIKTLHPKIEAEAKQEKVKALIQFEWDKKHGFNPTNRRFAGRPIKIKSRKKRRVRRG